MNHDIAWLNVYFRASKRSHREEDERPQWIIHKNNAEV
jgi:hypothetical protein